MSMPRAALLLLIACPCFAGNRGEPVVDKSLQEARQLIAKGYRQIFLDEVMIEKTEGLRRVVNQPTKHKGNPIIRHDQTPWQTFRAQLYGTAIYVPEEQKFKMWYLAGARLPVDEPITVDGRICCPNFQLVGYAESRDGFQFELPKLNLVNYNGSTANNLCRISRECAEGVAVVFDRHDPDPQRRYKALYWEHAVPYKGSPVTPVNAMSVSFSADGKQWTNHPDNPVIDFGSDTGQQALWDPERKRYVVFGRFGAGGRKVARSESKDFIRWSPPQLVFQADGKDGPNGQIYGMGISFYEGIYLGLPWLYHAGTNSKIDVQLATSRDGRHWTRVANRQVFIPNGPEGSWDAGLIFTASQPAQVVGDRIFFYYSGAKYDHERPPVNNEWNKTSIGVATLRRDGFVSLDATDKTGVLVTKAFKWPEDTDLHLNVDASDGDATVTVLDADQNEIAGFEQSREIHGDQLDVKVAWSDTSTDLDGLVRLRFTLRKAKLYSYWFTGGP
jgi:hypothetical protein